MEKPAIESGHPLREEFLPFAKPSIDQEEIDGVTEVLKSGWLTTGKKSKQFEEEFSGFIGCKHGIAVSSCTAGLHLSLASLGINPGDEVIVPSFTFSATANVVVHCGATPVFADINEGDFCLGPGDIRKKISEKTRAIIPVHYGGQSCDMDAIMEIANEHDLYVVEDCAHSPGATYKGKKTGTFGRLACFSFYATKNMTTGEGGMITTDDAELAEKLEVLRLHGLSKGAWKRYGKGSSWKYDVIEAGFKYNLSDLQAALGLAQLKKIERMNQRRRDIANSFSKAFEGNETLILPKELPERRHVWHLYALRLRLDLLSIDRDGFIEALAKENIGTSVHFIPLHLQPFYRDKFGCRQGMLPITEKVYEQEISLPIYPAMTQKDVDDVIKAVEKITKYYEKK